MMTNLEPLKNMTSSKMGHVDAHMQCYIEVMGPHATLHLDLLNILFLKYNKSSIEYQY